MTDSASGGGEFILDFNRDDVDPENAASTIAFTARVVGPDGAAEGEVQEVDRTRVGNRDPIAHGRVFCMRVEGNRAVMAYRPMQAPNSNDQVRQLYVQDNGEGPEEDVVVLDKHLPFPNVPACAFPVPSEEPPILGRGDVQVFDAE